jgi:hypothetical protein
MQKHRIGLQEDEFGISEEDAISILDNISKEIDTVTRSQLSLEALVFPAMETEMNHCAALDELLDPAEPGNMPILRYEQWYRACIKTLKNLSKRDIPGNHSIHYIAETLSERLAEFHSVLTVQILCRLRKYQSSRVNKVDIGPPDISLTQIEAEIAFAIRRFEYPSDVVINYNNMPTGDALCLLDKGHPNNAQIIDQVRWINSMSRQLLEDNQSRIPAARRHELTAGLKEQKENIMALIESQFLKLKGHKGRIITVQRCEYVASSVNCILNRSQLYTNHWFCSTLTLFGHRYYCSLSNCSTTCPSMLSRQSSRRFASMFPLIMYHSLSSTA